MLCPAYASKSSEKLYDVKMNVQYFHFLNLDISFMFTLQVKSIRKTMLEKISKDISQNDMKEVVRKLIADSYAKEVENACRGIYPLHDVHIRKVCFHK